ncbi:MAG: hypothetical protein WCA59_05625 [Candidatus Binataceae bacterium]
MKRGRVGPLGLAAIAGATLGLATGCSSINVSKAGWGAVPPNTGAPVAAQQGAPPFGETTTMHLTDKEQAVKPPSWIRVQDCTIVAISTPSRYACPDGKVYTGTELYQARSGS